MERRETYRVQNVDIQVGDLWVDTGIEECPEVLKVHVAFYMGVANRVTLDLSDGRTKELPAAEESLVERFPKGSFTGDFRWMGH